MGELAGVTFRWEHYSLPQGIKLTDRSQFLVTVDDTEHLEALVKFFEEVYVTLTTTRNVYRFRRDPE